MLDRIGPYAISRELGRGGMGVVYLGHDARLDRSVAIKALSEDFADDPARLERFEREARTLASLNHPNLGALLGLEEQDGARYLILEYVPGETLADRLDRGPLPPEEAVEAAAQIAAGLEAAHDAGVIHRDLKPANIKITPEGVAKVLDFGLARSADGSVGSSGTLDSPTLTTPQPQHSPTIEGAILGTAAYMSPEQARGRRVDKRTDIWSFGVVLYEMLAGASPFAGETASDSIGAVLHKAFDFERMPPATPSNVRRVLRRCLERDQNLRYRDIGDVRLELLAQEPDGERSGVGERPAPSRLWTPTVAGLAVVALLLAGALGWTWLARPSAGSDVVGGVERGVRKIDVITTDWDAKPWQLDAVISPDGSRIAFTRDDQIYVRSFDDFESIPIAGTEGATTPFWSPDSKHLGFRTGEGVFAIYDLRGSPTRITNIGGVQFRPAWTNDGRIILSIDGTSVGLTENNSRLATVPQLGGELTTLVPIDAEASIDYHAFCAIPDTDVVVFLEHRIDQSMPLIATDGERRIELADFEDMYTSTCAWSPTGHVLFTRGFGSLMDLWAAPFSPERMEATGEPFLVMSNVVHPSLATDGTLAVVRGTGEQAIGGEIGWLTADAEFELITEGGENVAALRLSPDGSMLAYAAGDAPMQSHVWVHDFERGFNRRLTKSSGFARPVAWSADGSELMVLRFDPARGIRFWTQFLATDGSGESREPYEGLISGVDPDWRFAAVAEDVRNPMQSRMVAMRMDDRSMMGTVIEGARGFGGASLFSPDGRHALLTSSRSGTAEVYCVEWPAGDNIEQVSTDGADVAWWSPAGSKVIFGSAEEADYYEADVLRTHRLSFSRPRPLFPDGADMSALTGLARSNEPDRFLAVRRGESLGERQPLYISIIENWLAPFEPPRSR
ncbi:MAG: protein kinase [Planctomycetota bacterium]